MIVKTQCAGKWVMEVRADDSIEVAALCTLKPRLSAVHGFLELSATKWKEDVEYVHQLRVYTRRSLAAMEFYRDVLPKKQRKHLTHCLREIRKAAGEARDMDVLLDKYRRKESSVWPGELLEEGSKKEWKELRKSICRLIGKRRKKAQKPIRRLYDEFVPSNRLKKCAKQCFSGISGVEPGSPQTFEPWAKARFAASVEAFVCATPKSGASVADWHRFRICGKHLRYTMELVSSIYDSDFRTRLYPCISEFQDRLGTLTDHAAATGHLADLKRKLKKKRHAKIIESMIAREWEQFAVSLVEFQAWWMVEAADQLEPLLDRYATAG